MPPIPMPPKSITAQSNPSLPSPRGVVMQQGNTKPIAGLPKNDPSPVPKTVPDFAPPARPSIARSATSPSLSNPSSIPLTFVINQAAPTPSIVALPHGSYAIPTQSAIPQPYDQYIIPNPHVPTGQMLYVIDPPVLGDRRPSLSIQPVTLPPHMNAIADLLAPPLQREQTYVPFELPRPVPDLVDPKWKEMLDSILRLEKAKVESMELKEKQEILYEKIIPMLEYVRSLPGEGPRRYDEQLSRKARELGMRKVLEDTETVRMIAESARMKMRPRTYI